MSKLIQTLLALILLQAPLHGFAHTNGETSLSFYQGLAHPFNGLDHLLAITLIGFCIGIYTLNRYTAVVFFIASMAIGAIGGLLISTSSNLVEIGITGSLIVIGCLVTRRTHISEKVFVCVISLFGIFHGLAHTNTIPPHPMGSMLSMIPDLTGLLISTLVILLAGMGLAKLVRYRHTSFLKITGMLSVSYGTVLLAQLIGQ